MKFDWISFLNEHGIEWVSEGPNVKRGNINIACPLCGDDPSHHMGLNLDTAQWGCWRNKGHRGGNPAWLISYLLRCPIDKARELVREGKSLDENASVGSLRARLSRLDDEKEEDTLNLQELPIRFEVISGRSTATRKYLHYIEDRGFGFAAGGVCARYGLGLCLSGDWSERIIIPVFGPEGLYGWTARALSKKATVRYKAHPHVKSGETSMVNRSVFNWQNICQAQEGDALVVCEGAIDAMKLDYALQRHGIHACAVMTTSMTVEQQILLKELVEKRGISDTFFIFDSGATAKAQETAAEFKILAGMDCNVEAIPFQSDFGEDFGDVPIENVENEFFSMIRG